MSLLSKPVTFLKEVKAELGKVAWSTRQELLGSTVVVIVTTGIVAIYIFVIDAVLTQFLNIIFK
jgi:preprotein translocase subunit SecE